jgi:hypothetical protein
MYFGIAMIEAIVDHVIICIHFGVNAGKILSWTPRLTEGVFTRIVVSSLGNLTLPCTYLLIFGGFPCWIIRFVRLHLKEQKSSTTVPAKWSPCADC